MKKLFTQESGFLLSHLQSLMEAEGIPSFIKNEYSGGASGEVPFLETWPELWLHRDEDFAKAKQILDDVLAAQLTANGSPWRCAHCGEENEPNFEICWQCSK